jgi:hypothetical protein
MPLLPPSLSRDSLPAYRAYAVCITAVAYTPLQPPQSSMSIRAATLAIALLVDSQYLHPPGDALNSAIFFLKMGIFQSRLRKIGKKTTPALDFAQMRTDLLGYSTRTLKLQVQLLYQDARDARGIL